MGKAPTTRSSLLVRIRDAGDHQAWSRFVEVYGPLIYGFGRKHGLQDADAGDLTQEVLQVLAPAIRGFVYDPHKGSFRGWLFTVVRNQLRNFLSAQRRQARGSGDTGIQHLLAEVPNAEDPLADSWEKDYESRLFNWAAEVVKGEVQDSTWQAFWKTAIEGHDPKKVADQLTMTVAAVYLAKSRVMVRLKEHIREIQEE